MLANNYGVNQQVKEQPIYVVYTIVAYLLKVRTVRAEERPLLANGSYTRSKERVTYVWRHATMEEVLQAAFSVDPRSSAAVNQHASTEEEVFSVGQPRGYITRISRS
jgi:hypothetical protein